MRRPIHTLTHLPMALAALTVAGTIEAQAVALCETISENLVQNCGFEQGFTGWAPYASAGVNGIPQRGPAHSGFNEAYLNAYPGHGGFGQAVPTTPGNEYLIRFWLASNGGNGVIEVHFGGVLEYQQYNPPVPAHNTLS